MSPPRHAACRGKRARLSREPCGPAGSGRWGLSPSHSPAGPGGRCVRWWVPLVDLAEGGLDVAQASIYAADGVGQHGALRLWLSPQVVDAGVHAGDLRRHQAGHNETCAHDGPDDRLRVGTHGVAEDHGPDQSRLGPRASAQGCDPRRQTQRAGRTPATASTAVTAGCLRARRAGERSPAENAAPSAGCYHQTGPSRSRPGPTRTLSTDVTERVVR